MIEFKGNVFAFTDGKGLWSGAQERISLTRLEVPYVNEEEDFAELRVYFHPETWNVEEQGLIYTDEFFLTGIRNRLVMDVKFSRAAADDVDYSEQGMQGDDYVSFDVGKLFLDEWLEVPGNTDHL
jgi:hypothetical protein